jgi:hypothetical protein
MLIRSIGRLASVLGCLTLAGCFVPGDPEGVSVGLRVEQETLVVYLPLCPGEKVVSGQIDDPRGSGKMLWRGEQPVRPAEKVIRLGAPDWDQETGSFSYHGQILAFEVDGTVRSYGAGLERKVLNDLPPGIYDVDGKKVTGAEIDQQADCPKSG